MTDDPGPGEHTHGIQLSDADVERIAARVVEKLYESRLIRRPKPVNDNAEGGAYATDRISGSRAELRERVRAKMARKGVI